MSAIQHGFEFILRDTLFRFLADAFDLTSFQILLSRLLDGDRQIFEDKLLLGMSARSKPALSARNFRNVRIFT